MCAKKQYLAKNGQKQWKPSLKWIESVAYGDEGNEGFCLACGETQSGVEPDGRKYKCESCGAMKVYGAEELALMGLCY